MPKIVPVQKMSKKAQKELARKRRETWTMNPITRKVENKKRTFREKTPRDYGTERFPIRLQMSVSTCKPSFYFS